MMQIAAAAALITRTVERDGLLLVHDQVLPSVTALIAGEPVPGSWWSHPMANLIYNALNTIEDQVASCKLVSKKVTLVAPRLWPDLVSVGSSKQPWQLQGLPGPAKILLDRVESSSHPMMLDSPELTGSGKRLEERLLVAGDEVHTDSGRHVKVLISWARWRKDHGVAGRLPSPESGLARFEGIVQGWKPTRRVLPWPAPSRTEVR